jgi:hypothetical protein
MRLAAPHHGATADLGDLLPKLRSDSSTGAILILASAVFEMATACPRGIYYIQTTAQNKRWTTSRNHDKFSIKIIYRHYGHDNALEAG